MKRVINSIQLINFSLLGGFLSFFQLSEKKVDIIYKNVIQRNDFHSIANDFSRAGQDVKTSFDKEVG